MRLFFERALAALLVLAIRAYQALVSPLLGPACRYWPTCSEYAVDALRAHGAVRGGWMALRRVCRCHPLGGSGFDPVPGGRDRAAEGAPGGRIGP